MATRLRTLAEEISAARVIFATLIGAMAIGASLAATRADIKDAVKRPEYQAHVALEDARHAQSDSAIQEGQRRLEVIAIRQEDRDCAEKGYPLPWCRPALERQRAIEQAGRPR